MGGGRWRAPAPSGGMTSMTVDDGRYVGISEVAESTGFSRDTLREGAATHHQRLALLAAHRDRIVARLTELQSDRAVLEKKTEHYRYLIEQGLDCDTP
jgi:hypothetical protein